MNPKLSIVIPTFNEERIIEKSLSGIRNHLHGIDYELIVTDDGSSDRTCEIAERYADTVVRLTGAKGTIGANRNRGARAARGEYLILVDADIVIPQATKFFTAILENFRKTPRLVGMTVRITFFPGEERMIDRVMHTIIAGTFWFMNSIMHIGSASGEFQAIRRDVFEKVHGYNETLPVGEDNELFSRLSKLGSTRIDLNLVAHTDNRRVKKLGWFRLVKLWMVNYFSVAILRRSQATEWPPK